MKEETKHNIDSLFKDGLQQSSDNLPYQETDWEAMEGLLDGGAKKRGLLKRLPLIISAVAAMLVLLSGWFLFRPQSTPETKNNEQVKANQTMKKDTGNYGQPMQQLAVSGNSKPLSVSKQPLKGELPGRKSESLLNLSAAEAGHHVTGFSTIDTAGAGPAQLNTPDSSAVPGAATVAANALKADMVNPANTADTTPPTAKVAMVPVAKLKTKPAGSFRPTFAISVLASSDVNSVQSLSQNKLGTSAGIALTIGLSKKWSVSTGAFYADKPYMVPFSGYKSSFKFNTDPATVSASCIVLDIPVNVGYQVYHQNRNKLTLGAGLSSYFMLRENYTFNYPASYSGAASTSNYNISNQNRHLFGVANINATYQRRINARFDLGIQPYLKLPLTNIGYGQVNLKSAGVAVGVMWNLNTHTKP